mmetsp:Transcript_8293/g.12769  ORF Transcript_8293/g.12769 Transcript_8293/m.12769 type:complete len:192 (+) Transcript_8293:27-602(+)
MCLIMEDPEVSTSPCLHDSKGKLLNDSDGNLVFDLQSLRKYEKDEESFVEVNTDLKRRARLRRNASVIITTVDSRQRQVREALDLRYMSFVNDHDNYELKKIQAQLRKSGVNTGVGVSQFLNKAVAETIIEQRRKDPMHCLEQRVTQKIANRRRSTMSRSSTMSQASTETQSTEQDRKTSILGMLIWHEED